MTLAELPGQVSAKVDARIVLMRLRVALVALAFAAGSSHASAHDSTRAA
ncbi:MAG: hypothetical protein M3256_25150 [Actinomycetota bacterium]|nr:hypothetical protein [Actinomycetota bacterium]